MNLTQDHQVYIVALRGRRTAAYYVLSAAQRKALPPDHRRRSWKGALEERGKKGELLGLARCLADLFALVAENKWSIVGEDVGPKYPKPLVSRPVKE